MRFLYGANQTQNYFFAEVYIRADVITANKRVIQPMGAVNGSATTVDTVADLQDNSRLSDESMVYESPFAYGYLLLL